MASGYSTGRKGKYVWCQLWCKYLFIGSDCHGQNEPVLAVDYIRNKL